MVKSVGKAARYGDRYLRRVRRNREWVRDFWVRHVEDKRASGSTDTDQDFVQLVVDVQRFVYGDAGDAATGVDLQPATESEMDGRLGSGTSRRMEAWISWVDEDDAALPVPTTESDDCILVDGQRLPVGGGVQVVSLDEDGGRWSLEEHSSRWGSRKPTILSFGHWDVCTSAEKCHRVLAQRGLSSGGCFDNPTPDGRSTFYQFLDPAKRYGYHGGGTANRSSFFSYDLSNAVSVKYADGYEKKVGIARPTLHLNRAEQLGRGTVFLGMYAGQIHSLLYVLKALAEYSGKPLVFPVRADGTPLGANWNALWKSGYAGCATHHHLPRTTKWDVRGLEYQIAVMFLTNRLPMGEFPSLVESFRLHDACWVAWMDEFEKTCRWPELGLGD